MFRTDQQTAVTAIPAPTPAGTPGFFTGGNPATGLPATILDADWLNMVQEELMSILAAAGISPSKTTYSQVLAAIQQLTGTTISTVKGIAKFTSSGSWTVPAGVTQIFLSGCAAGSGGAGGGGSTNVTGTGAGGAGGNAGQSVTRQAYSVVPGSTVNITIGAPSPGGTAGLPTANGGSSSAGGNTVISGTGFNGGTSVTLVGGSGSTGGAYFSNAGVPSGGTPGANGFPKGSCGADGASGFNGNGCGGAGASCPFGGGGGSGRAGATGVDGSAGYGYGSGGGGGGGGYGLSSGGANGGVGGTGMPGVAIIEW
ncbi:TPA: hypothetical protein QDC03_005830 [Burkholderia cepacia]|uniref:glycine-rich domain-containing protein n=1 Tax=Burkholderia cepacia TaxID=292 RepID=UPI0015E2D1B0|nr:hypothetical protein [Burkholderia cepacia]HDR9510655.1 hypothetical protein [Burkholderia cepacia]